MSACVYVWPRPQQRGLHMHSSPPLFTLICVHFAQERRRKRLNEPPPGVADCVSAELHLAARPARFAELHAWCARRRSFRAFVYIAVEFKTLRILCMLRVFSRIFLDAKEIMHMEKKVILIQANIHPLISSVKIVSSNKILCCEIIFLSRYKY